MFGFSKKIITRFPPSPTGPFHIGNARTALFNYFFTKQNKGKLLFRLEDTDKERSKNEYSKDIIEGLKWLGLDIDFTNPYKQSEHSETYKKYLEKLLKEGKAYISKEEVTEEGQRSEVIRLKNPGKKIKFDDLVRGEIEVDTTELGDFVIAKSVDEPIYHFAVVVDDFEMKVTHILRGEDGIYNTPRQILIQEAIGANRPIYAHVPFILNEDRSKLSKRKQGESVSLTFYRKEGYLPEAMVNFLAFTGWNPGGEKEIMTMDEIIKAFDIKKVQKSGAIFNKEKLLWMNKEHIKRLPQETLQKIVKEHIDYTDKYKKNNWKLEENLLKKLTPIIIDRIYKFKDITELIEKGELDFCFSNPTYKPEELYWKGEKNNETKIYLEKIISIIEKIPENKFDAENIKSLIWDYATEKGRGQVLWPMRFSLTGLPKSPDPFIVGEIIGKEKTIFRLKEAVNKI